MVREAGGRSAERTRARTSRSTGRATRFGFLGAVALWKEDGEVRLSTRRARTVMARLLLSPGQLVSMDALVDGLYGERPVKSARNQIHRGVGELRQQGVLIVEQDGSYLLSTPTEVIDAWRFKSLTESARTAAHPRDKARLLQEALKVWRGPALAGLDSQVFRAAAEEWEERRLTAIQERFGADLALGNHNDLIPEIRRLTSEHPMREHFSWQLMTACYRAGRTGEAIAAFTRLREELAEQLGIDPSPELRHLYEQILRQEPVPTEDAPVPRQLPPRPLKITGRSWELERIRTALERGSRTVAITGASGSGKTTLALEAAHGSAELFPDGQLYNTEPDDVLPGMLRALGDTRVPKRQDEQNGRLRTLLASRRILIVVENVAGAAQVRSFLPACRECALIVTSRSSLSSLREAVQITLGGLSVDDAWALLADGVGAHRLAAEPEATHRVIELCDGLPLAVDIIAAKLAARPHWDIATLAARLEDPDRILSELRHDDLDIRAALDSGYLSLSPEARTLLRKIGYSGKQDVSVQDASCLEKISPAEAEWRIEALVDARMLTVSGMESGGRFTYHCPPMVLAHSRERALTEDQITELDAAVSRVLTGMEDSTGRH
ncbi:BTAD domain-containing putative transcriptional regulator [Streptosporangium sp. NPDC000239]|uniref:AfsR/SARP family transcriptional regulator n=1 Tax=Streptosporangium sp. NPDC000239 TaxID=3154248 RepID=UPI00332FF66F